MHEHFSYNNNFRQILGTLFGTVKGNGYGREHCIDMLPCWTRAKFLRLPPGLHKLQGRAGCLLGDGCNIIDINVQ